MVEITVDEEKCNGCGICREVCPKGPRIWDIQDKGGRKLAVVIDISYCIYCTDCATRCPTNAIKVKL